MSDLFNPLGSHTPPVENPLQKRADVCGTVRAAEGDEQNGIEQNRTLTYAARDCQRLTSS